MSLRVLGRNKSCETAPDKMRTAAVVVLAGCALYACSAGQSPADTAATADGPGLTTGRYLGQDWQIDRNHVLYWDGKPFIPNAIPDFSESIIAVPDPQVPIAQLEGEIDAAMKKGITQFLLDVIHMPASPSEAEASNERIRRVTEHIHAKGGTYFLMYSLDVPKAKLAAKQDAKGFQQCMTRSADARACSEVPLQDLLKPEMLETLRQDLRRLGKIAATPALRAFELFGESEDWGGTTDEMIAQLATVFDVYGKIAKQEIGDVPVLMRGTGEGMRVPLSGLRAEHVDGVRMQISGPMPAFVRTAGRRYSTLILRVLNACSKTKLYWSYSQGRLSGTYFLYRSKELLRGHFRALIEAGVTGFPYDQSPGGSFASVGGPDDTVELRQQNHQWWVELQPEFQAEILRRAQGNEFSSGSWAEPMKEAEWRPPASTLDARRVETIASNHPDVRRLLDLGAVLWHVQFFPDYSAWMAAITGPAGEGGMVWELWIDDSPEAGVWINGIELVEKMRQAGYPVPSDEAMLQHLECGPPGECRTADGDRGCACSDAASSFCTTERIFDGCCVAGVCS